MVLEAAFDDSSPTNDFDAYESNDKPSQTGNGAVVDLSKASRPFPILGPLAGFTNERLLTMATGIARDAPRIIQRPLTQDEVDGVVASVSKGLQVHSWIYCNGLIIGGFRAQATRSNMGFPANRFIKTMSINFDSFGPLKAPVSRVIWNAVRTTLWLAWWGLPAYVIGGLAGSYSMYQTQMDDERMKQFHQDMKSDGAKQRLGDVIQRRQQGLPRQPVQRSDGQTKDLDEMSPQLKSGTTNFGSEDARRRSMEYYMGSNPKEAAPEFETGKTEPDRGNYRYRRQNETSSSSASDEQTSQNATGGSAWDRVRAQAGQNESAWDRVRRGSGSNEGSPMAPNQWQSQQNNVPLTDSFTFDERDEDRQLAKIEAQKDFDSRVERERQGKDFEDSRSGGRRW